MILVIEGWGSLNHIQSAMEKNGEDNQKVKKVGRVVS
jgi:hypothetical protein